DPPKIERGGTKESIVRDAAEGLHFVKARPGLFGMLIMFTAIEFVERMCSLLATPLVLSTSTPAALGVIRSTSVGGVLCGSAALGAFGGPRKNKMKVILWCCVLEGACFLCAGSKVPMVGLAIIVFGAGLVGPVVASLSDTIWQSKVPTQMLGR